MKSNVAKAIGIIEECRNTHILWRDFLEAEPSAADDMVRRKDAVGDMQHHERCIEDYDFVLDTLKNLGGKHD